MVDKTYDLLTERTQLEDGDNILIGGENSEIFKADQNTIVKKAIEDGNTGTLYKKNADGELEPSSVIETDDTVQILKRIETNPGTFSLEQLLLKAYGAGLNVVSNATGKVYDIVYNERNTVAPFIATVDTDNLIDISLQPVPSSTTEITLPVTISVTTNASYEFLSLLFRSKGNISNFRFKIRSVTAGTDSYFYPNKLDYERDIGVEFTGAVPGDITERSFDLLDDLLGSTPARYLTGLDLEITVDGEDPDSGGKAVVMGDVSGIPFAQFSVANLSLVPISTSEDLDLIKQIHSDAANPTGIVDRSCSEIDVTDSVLSLNPLGGGCDFYIKGVKHTLDASTGITLSGTEGVRYIYMDSNKELFETGTFDVETILKNNVYVSALYWSTTNNKSIYTGDERHGLMDWAVHSYLHEVFGTQYMEGLGFSNFTIGEGTFDSHSQFSYGSGIIRDEDIIFNIPSSPTIAQIPVYYREGTAPVIRRKEPDNFPLIGKNDVTVTDRPKFNENLNGTWQLTEVDSGSFFLVHYYATNDINNPVIGFAGIAQYGNANQAKEAAASEINSITGLPFQEFVTLGTVIYETGAYANESNAKIVQYDVGINYVDFRNQSSTTAGSSGGASPTEHNTLNGRDLDDSHPLAAISYDNVTSGYTAEDGQAAIDESAANHVAHVDSTTAHDSEDIVYDPALNPVSTDTNVKSAIDTVGTALNDHVIDDTAAHNATAIAFTSATGLTSTDVSTGLDEVNQDLLDYESSNNLALNGHIDGTVGAHNASAIAVDTTNFLSLSGDDVQEMLVNADASINAHVQSDSEHDIQVNNLTQYFFVDESGVDLDNDQGSIKFPFATLNVAINRVTSGSSGVVELGKGTFTGNISGLAKTNLLIKGQAVAGSFNTTYTGRLDTDTPMSRLRVRDISIVSTENEAFSCQSSDNGRHVFENVSFASADSDQVIKISGMSNWCKFERCSIDGRITFDNSSGTIFIIGNSNSNLEIVNNSAGTIHLIDSVCSSITNNGTGSVFISGESNNGLGAVIPTSGTGTISYIQNPYIAIDSDAHALLAGENTYTDVNNFSDTTNFTGAIHANSSSDIQLGGKFLVDNDNVRVNDHLFVKEEATPAAVTGYSSITPTTGSLIVSRRSNGDIQHFDAWRLIFASTAHTASHYDKIFADTSTAGFTISLPAARVPGMPVLIFDHTGGNALVIDGNGANIEVFDSAGASLGTDTSVTTTQNRRYEFIATLAGWRLNL